MDFRRHLIRFFQKKNKSNTKFYSLLKDNTQKDVLILNSYKDFNSDCGLLSDDYATVINTHLKTDLLIADIQEDIGISSACYDAMDRFIIALMCDVDFSYAISSLGSNLKRVFQISLLYGRYEEYGVESQVAIGKALKCELIDNDDFFRLSILRGAVLSKRYPSPESEKSLRKKVAKNTMKIKIGL